MNNTTATTTATASAASAATLTTRFHRDNSVTVWNVYTQSWQRVRASRIADEILASLSPRERARIAKAAARC
jgi:hypothetical protein